MWTLYSVYYVVMCVLYMYTVYDKFFLEQGNTLKYYIQFGKKILSRLVNEWLLGGVGCIIDVD